MTASVVLAAGAATVVRRRHLRLPDVTTRDVVLTALATQRVSRVLARDPITSPIRVWKRRPYRWNKPG